MAEEAKQTSASLDSEAQSAVAWLKSIAHEGAHLRLDSREVNPGDVFVAVPGAKVDGRAFIRVAAARGASGVLYESSGSALPDAEHYPLAAHAVPALKSRLGCIASAFYEDPSSAMTGVAVTGTNGKTTTSFWISQLLTSLGKPCATIGTVGVFFNREQLPSPELTTPDAVSLQGIYSDLRRAGARAYAIEASSVGLEQGRLTGSHFRVGVFTNLTRDHLDYHRTMAAYEAAKGILFSWPGLESAVINADDPDAPFFAKTAKDNGCSLWYTSSKGKAEALAKTVGPAHIVAADDLRVTDKGIAFTLSIDGASCAMHVSLIGAFNVDNMLSSAAAVLALVMKTNETVALLPSLVPPPGRMEMMHSPDAPLCVVDFGHTPDALEKALTALISTAKARGGRLWVLFGCGGDRDKGKRPMMGEIAGRLADRVVITSDNPRSEDPLEICREVAAGVVPGSAEFVIEPDRAKAVEHAVLAADPADVVLVAGKGHETVQIDAHGAQHYSDQEAVRAAFNERHMRAMSAKISEQGHD